MCDDLDAEQGVVFAVGLNRQWSTLTGAELIEVEFAIERLLNQLEAAQALVLAALELQRDWAAHGARSVAVFIELATGADRARVASQVRLGRRLREAPLVQAAAVAGELPRETVRRVLTCRTEATAEAFSRDEADLVGWARELPGRDLAQVLRSWLAHADPDGSEPRRAQKASTLHVGETFEGRFELKGSFAPDDGRLLAAALDAGVDRRLNARRDGDPSDEGLTVTAIRASVLVDLLTGDMRREPSDSSVPDRYRVGILITAEQVAELAASVEGCDASWYRTVMSATGEVLDVGRATSQWSVGIRRAIVARDRTCAFPGCDMPPSKCDVHHCEHWANGGRTAHTNGGRTAHTNGVLLCRHHHTFIHRQLWRIEMIDDQPIVIRPDGTIHTTTRWPHTTAEPSRDQAERQQPPSP